MRNVKRMVTNTTSALGSNGTHFVADRVPLCVTRLQQSDDDAVIMKDHTQIKTWKLDTHDRGCNDWRKMLLDETS